MHQLDIGVQVWVKSLVVTTTAVPVVVIAVPIAGVATINVGEGVAAHVVANSAIKNTADAITVIRGIVKAFSEDSTVAPVPPPNPPAITQAISNTVSNVKKQIETNTAGKDPKITPPPKEPPEPIKPPPN